MLEHLYIENIALIDTLKIDFSKGLNILSGETGAGKSIIIDSVNLVLGERADKELIKSGRDKARVEAAFKVHGKSKILTFLKENSLDNDESVILSREITISGKNICRINGHTVTLAMLKNAGDNLVDVHGQHEHQSLLNTVNHMNILDNFAAAELGIWKTSVHELYKKYKDISNKLTSRFGSERDRERMLDILNFQINEIEKSRLKTGEDEELHKERQLLVNGEKISESLEKAYFKIYGGSDSSSTLDSIRESSSLFENLLSLDEKFVLINNRLNEAYYVLEDAAIEIREYRNAFEFDRHRLEEVEKRLDEITRLKKKYGSTIEEIIEFLQKARQEYDDILSSEENIKDLQAKKELLFDQLYECSMQLSHTRRLAGKQFEEKVLMQLSDLGLAKSRFEVAFSDIPERDELASNDKLLTAAGFDNIEFMISTNVGEPLKPLSRVASGGEMSRIMLAIKNITADLDEIPCMIFDEIDTGISGKIAQVVAEKLLQTSIDRQVICVTHLSQIASMADTHYLISKSESDERTATNIVLLKNEERYMEVARLTGGMDISSVGLEHARQMVDWSMQFKKKLVDNVQ
jgi:DNA repair protein RecN (Recombination protein N)